MKKNHVILIISTIISIILTGILPSLLTAYIPINFYILLCIICIFLVIIFALIQYILVKRDKEIKDSLEDKLKNEIKSKTELQTQFDEIDKEKKLFTQKINDLEKEKSELLSFKEKNEKNSYAATGIVFNKTFTKVLLAYHEKQKRWIPPGSHVRGIQHLHRLVIESTKTETGYIPIFHESHNYEQYEDDNCCVVPCPFSVQIEKQIVGEGHDEHYDFLYILVADENDDITKPGSHKIKWLSFNQLQEYAKRNNTYPDVVQSVQEAISIIAKKEEKNENK